MLNVILCGTFVIDLIKSSLIFWSQKLPTPFNFSFAPYNQLFQQILDPDSLLSKNTNGINVLVIRAIDLNYSEENAKLLIDALKMKAENRYAKYILCLCPDNSRLHHSFETNLISELKKINGLCIIKKEEILTLCPADECFDEHTDRLAHIPYTLKFFTALGTLIARKVYVFSREPFKVIVLDCDQTLWNGVCGEDKVANIQISAAYQYLQHFMFKQAKAGMLLCLASKNNEDDVFAVFDKHPQMILKPEDITSYKINWLPKSQNLKSFAEQLNLGLNSFIFIDDNPVECAEVKSHFPEARPFYYLQSHKSQNS